MTAGTQSVLAFRFPFALAILCLGWSLALAAQGPPPCSLSKTNQSCELVIDRSNPVAPSTVQMYSDQELTVRIKNPLPFERYFLDFTTGQAALTPDVASSVIGGMFANLGKLQIVHTAEVVKVPGAAPVDPCANGLFANALWPPAGGVTAGQQEFWKCFGVLASSATKIYKTLEPLVAPDSLTPGAGGTPATFVEPGYYRTNYDAIKNAIDAYVTAETTVSTKITALTKVPTQQNPPSAPPAPLVYSSAADQTAITQLVDDQKIIDAIVADLLGYKQRLVDLGPCNYGSAAKTSADCTGIADVVITSRTDQQTIYQGMVTRTITYSLDSLNLVSNSQQAVPNVTNKKALAVVAINFADRPNKSFIGVPFTALRFEASAGVYFSTLPNRTFTLSSTGMVQDSKTRPTPIPFAAANYRLTDDLPGRWKNNFYLTGTVGINPNTTTTDFGAGISYAWRALMLSALCDFGHDVRPTQASLTSGSTSSLPTTSHWTEAFAIGISVRVPSLTGR
jgi:hypothetical protein